MLEVKELKTIFSTQDGVVNAVNDISFSLQSGEAIGIVGESGCGKSVSMLSIMRLIPNPPGKIVGGEVFFQGRDILKMNQHDLQDMRGNQISMVFQDPLTSLNPVKTIGNQISETVLRHTDKDKKQAEQRAVELLKMVGIPEAENRLKDYPHQFSGGMRQRVMIAIALSCNPQILIADEPTTALDVTLEAQVIHLLQELKNSFECSILFVSHNLGLIAELCDEVVVMYAGEVVEQGDVFDLFHSPAHPYTQRLLECDPARIEKSTDELPTISGRVPDLIELPPGCIFSPRCVSKFEPCSTQPPPEFVVNERHKVSCFLSQDG